MALNALDRHLALVGFMPGGPARRAKPARYFEVRSGGSTGMRLDTQVRDPHSGHTTSSPRGGCG